MNPSVHFPPCAAWAMERFGSKRMWLIGLSLFVLDSLASGLSWNVERLIVFRVAQGFGGGMLDPIMPTVLATAAGPALAGRVMGLMGIVIPLAPILGPILGGVIVQGLEWRWMFLINVPIGLAAILLSLRVVPAGPPIRTRATSPRLDVIGLALLGPAFAVLVFALSQATGNAPPVRTALILGTLLGSRFSPCCSWCRSTSNGCEATKCWPPECC
ncbi:MFS transporter [Streptomyces noursei]|uniref:MFS transporter n=1 Tax=Streptomyces noursei TaxID=1971 RepID=UPI0022B7F526